MWSCVFCQQGAGEKKTSLDNQKNNRQEKYMKKTSVVVIGSGESGIEAVEFFAENNHSVLLIEQDRIGGSYLSLHDLNLKEALIKGKEFSSYLEKFRDFPETYKVLVQERSSLLSKLKSMESERLIETENIFKQNPLIEIIKGSARFISPSIIEVETPEGRELVSFEFCICATGKQDLELPYIEGSDEKGVWNEYSIFESNELPSSICIIGCTESTLNFAFLYAQLGIKVHICDADTSSNVLPAFDKTILNSIFKTLSRHQVEFHFDCLVSSLSKKGDVFVIPTKNSIIEVSDVLITTKKLFSDTVGASSLSLKYTSDGFVTTDEGRVYGSEKIYAIGEANDKYSINGENHVLHTCIYAVNQELNKSRRNQSATHLPTNSLTLPKSSDAEFTRISSITPRIIGNFEGVTLGLPEHQARSMFGPSCRSEAFETSHGDIVKITYSIQSEKLIGIGLSGQLSKDCLLFATYCLDKKKKFSEFTTYLKNFLDLF